MLIDPREISGLFGLRQWLPKCGRANYLASDFAALDLASYGRKKLKA
jgi:hypothetical protein